ncbi:MAG: hypothetical protein O7A06_14435 [Acidobacteria bacterium]|nr:hypothetical protein [Acidobacteriota bacterium]MCZ6752985.1 hypothetical protein [Acidobacteriota bacterium]
MTNPDNRSRRMGFYDGVWVSRHSSRSATLRDLDPQHVAILPGT